MLKFIFQVMVIYILDRYLIYSLWSCKYLNWTFLLVEFVKIFIRGSVNNTCLHFKNIKNILV